MWSSEDKNRIRSFSETTTTSSDNYYNHYKRWCKKINVVKMATGKTPVDGTRFFFFVKRNKKIKKTNGRIIVKLPFPSHYGTFLHIYTVGGATYEALSHVIFGRRFETFLLETFWRRREGAREAYFTWTRHFWLTFLRKKQIVSRRASLKGNWTDGQSGHLLKARAFGSRIK